MIAPIFTPEIRWLAPPARPTLNGSDTHVWAACLPADVADLAEYATCLSPDEHKRAARFHSERDRDCFIFARGFLRNLLGGYLDCDPAELQFVRGPFGKPALAGAPAGHDMHFNLAHSEDMVLAAFSRAGPVGVDLERIRPLDDALDLADRFFSPRESADIRRRPADAQPEAFFDLWTRKEAWLKATGEGIANSLDLPLPSPSSRWHFQGLAPAQGFAAAVALDLRSSAFASRHCRSGAPRLECWRWSA